MVSDTSSLLTGSFSPIDAARSIGDSYRRYLKSRYAPSNDVWRAELTDALDSRFRIDRGPFVQALPNYEPGRSINELVIEGVLHDRMGLITPGAFPTGRALHRHQEVAVRKILAGRNVVIATGTGSGKTECYLMPILDALLREADQGTLREPGVRAMLLYPMNALANDQMLRIRGLLRSFPEITFGRFTGATPDSRRRGEEEHRQETGEVANPNELVSREQMRNSPPHILLTNYAMLEYLLLRPEDTALFDGPTGCHWRFIVLDEMHIYSGARGAEIAMLLRRVRDRVHQSTPGKISFIGTSATLGSGGDAKPRIAEYAFDLFGERVEHHSHDETRRDIVTPSLIEDAYESTWSVPPGGFAILREALASNHTDSTLFDEFPPEISTAVRDGGSTALLQALSAEIHVNRLRQQLQQEPVDVTDAANDVFGDPSRIHEFPEFLEVCTTSYGGAAPVLPARFHYLVRALEGAFVCVSPRHSPDAHRLHLERNATCPDCSSRGLVSLMFELGLCGRCGASYLVGSEDTEALPAGDTRRVKQALQHERRLLYLLLDEEAETDDEDEVAAVDDDVTAAAIDRQWLCVGCGNLVENARSSCECDHSPGVIAVTVARPARVGQPLRRCPACSGRTNADIVLRFFTGQDAPVAVVATALYQALPPSPLGEPDRNNPVEPKVGEGRKLLSFSDNRQDAAFFAPYLDRTYSRAIQRRLVWEVLRTHRDDELRFEDLVPLVRGLAEDALVTNPADSPATNRTKASLWLMAEVLATDRRQSLDGVGLAEITVAAPHNVVVPSGLTGLGFSDREAVDLALVMIETLRAQAAVHLPDGVEITDQAFAPRNVVTAVRSEGPAPGVIAWLPAKGANRRIDYLQKLIQRRGIQVDLREVLIGLWRWLTSEPWREVLRQTSHRVHGTVFRINHERIAMLPASQSHLPFECTKCHRVTWRSVSDVCPSFLCDGSLRAVDASDLSGTDHYRRLYTELHPSGMKVKEHTGQLRIERAREFQRQFLDGDVNTLSCTTTFELGVDVGDVQAVLMRNVPPSPANYVQRAGRAGRRATRPALVVTFAQRRSHDLHHFREPRRLVEGHVGVPVLSLRNPLIARRHIHAIAFAAFERRHCDSGGQAHRTVASFFMSQGDKIAPVDEFVAWLRDRPQELGGAIARTVPDELHEALGVSSWGWAADLVDDADAPQEAFSRGWLRRATEEVRTDIRDIDSDIDEAADRSRELRRDNQSVAAAKLARFQNALLKVRNTLETRRLIDYLATRVVLPKYGFPVDVVTLDVSRSGDARSEGLSLDRDLRIGIADYAPGSLIVADKALWEATGLRILPGKSLLSYLYGTCAECDSFRTKRVSDESDTDLGSCPTCESSAIRDTYRFVVPEFGFVGRRSKDEPGESRPPKAGWSQFHFSDYEGEPPSIERVDVGLGRIGMRFSRQGRITVVNRGPVGGGFMVCMSCGHADTVTARRRDADTAHARPGTQRDCTSWLSHRHLGHQYLTDVVELEFPFAMDDTRARSLLYALLAAAPVIGIPSSDIDGTLRPRGKDKSATLVVFDTVPGGAGHVRRIHDSLPTLLEGARRVVMSCGCAVTTSCYGCIRTYSNQRFHDDLARGDALNLLGRLLPRDQRGDSGR